MRFRLSEDQQAIGRAVADMLRAECSPAVVRAAWEGEPATEAWAALAEMGVLGMLLPESSGGLGLGLVDLCPVLQAAGEVALPGPLVELSAVAIPLLGELGDARAAAAARGDLRVAIGHPLCPLVQEADRAELILWLDAEGVRALRGDQARSQRRPSVDRSRRLFEVEGDWQLLAGGDRARAAVQRALDRAAWASSALLVGLGSRALAMAIEHAGIRHQFGRPIGSFQAVKHQLASAHVGLRFAEPHLLRAAWTMDQQAPGAGLHCSMAKHSAGQAAARACRSSLQVHGAIGYSFEHDLHLWMKRVWARQRLWGDRAHHRQRLAAALRDGRLPRATETPHA